ncbi:hypothetical protein [Cellulosimicrobium sp. CUA-896]|uniref:hypothetical protein n=1 Tax=Cellulosimicrobium sp. CUA-896 TaxID=1517881 RepID=UPI0009639AD7|nr:hypothetical protein [Cellulosimicrobium sp. CUA-896]OLT52243.1 hypothetical protein BJF88_14195 [Cellulosimicrobium sp. CUA-896]
MVLPFEELYNSGSVLLALSLNRPVLVPASPSSVRLRDEVGAHWVRTYAGPLTAAALEEAYEAVARRAETEGFGAAQLHGREWPEIARAHVEVFRGAARGPHDGAGRGRR